jgi:hypothetical protein
MKPIMLLSVAPESTHLPDEPFLFLTIARAGMHAFESSDKNARPFAPASKLLVEVARDFCYTVDKQLK